MNPDQITAELRDIKPAVEIPEMAAGLAPWAIAGIAAAIIILLATVAWWLYLSRRKEPVADPVNDAFHELDLTREILTSADSEAYAIAVSDVLRRYIERYLGTSAVRQTTDEFLASLAEGVNSPIREHGSTLREFLAQCDLVKFARGELGNEEREQLHRSARDFIEKTAKARKAAASTAQDGRTLPRAQSPLRT